MKGKSMNILTNNQTNRNRQRNFAFNKLRTWVVMSLIALAASLISASLGHARPNGAAIGKCDNAYMNCLDRCSGQFRAICERNCRQTWEACSKKAGLPVPPLKFDMPQNQGGNPSPAPTPPMATTHRPPGSESSVRDQSNTGAAPSASRKAANPLTRTQRTKAVEKLRTPKDR